jgi:hypothetical protein
MRKYLIIFSLMFSQVCSAAQHVIATPAFLKGATVTVTLKNGKTHTFKSEEYAVVPRLSESPDAEPVAAPVAKAQEKAPLSRPNSVKLYGGVGPNMPQVEGNGSDYSVKQQYGFNYGLGYGRKLSDPISLDGILLMNPHGAQGGLLGLGYNW